VSDENSAGGQLTLGYDISNRFSVEGHLSDLGRKFHLLVKLVTPLPV